LHDFIELLLLFLFIANLNEAREKTNKALILSDLSGSDEYNTNLNKKGKDRYTQKKISSPPTFKPLPSTVLYFN